MLDSGTGVGQIGMRRLCLLKLNFYPSFGSCIMIGDGSFYEMLCGN